MKVNNLLKVQSIFYISIPIVFAKTINKCDELLGTINSYTSFFSCKVNEQGDINYLNVNDYDLTENDINKILSYTTITELSYTLNRDTNHQHNGYAKFPQFSKLKNLNTLLIKYSDIYNDCSFGFCQKIGLSIIPENTFKGLTNLETLTFDGIKINQNCIDDISSLGNLKNLSFYKSDFSENIDYTPISSLEKITKLTISKSIKEYHDSDGIFPINLVKNLDGQLKDLTINHYPESDYEDVEEMTTIEKLNLGLDTDTVNLKKMSGLKECYIHFERMMATDLINIDLTLPESENLNSLMIKGIQFTNGIIDEITEKTSIKSLSLSGGYKKLSYDKLNDLINLNNLETLKLAVNDSDDESIDLNIDFTKFPNLKSLGLEEVKFTNDTISNISKLVNLCELELGYSEIDAGLLNQLKSLKDNLSSLSLIHCDLDSIPNFIFSLSNLKYLNLGYNSILDFNENLSNLKNLESLILKSNNIKTEIPESLNSLTKLKEINLEFNNVKGKTLTNPSLETCIYGQLNSLCLAKKNKCIKEVIRPCEKKENEKCGKGIGKCSSGQCCSRKGYCGTTKDYCGKGCQSEFGNCYPSSSSTITKTVTMIRNSKPTNKAIRCGKGIGHCPSDNCCSRKGYCGTTNAYCGTGCQSEFGKCN
ncbi:L domain-like protein [Piromyces finnis]|uniref:L domain-like protein n=1 Tax=Piromyces finnis TaxID=1754191 RepID=A0A1Y1V8V2_9FUNG|nr:L domain-like protein [Piromyces finnis]|eukprot:ORX49613.1 L domain-like protein [Piromyces finnis]